MAKFASIITLLFIALVLFVAFEAPTMVGAEESYDYSQGDVRQQEPDDYLVARAPIEHVESPPDRKGNVREPEESPPVLPSGKGCARPSGTFLSGDCTNNEDCRKNCGNSATHGSCNPKKECICYFGC